MDKSNPEQFGINEPELHQRVIDGDPVAIGEFFEELLFECLHFAEAYALGKRIQPELLENAVQDVILKCLEDIEGFIKRPKKSTFRNYLFIVVRNRIIDQLRRGNRDRAHAGISLDTRLLNEDTGEQCLWSRIESGEPEPDAQAAFEELIESFMNSLTPENAEIFSMYKEGYTQKEIVEKLELPQTTVNNVNFRSRQALKQWLNDHGYEID